jgi:uncharacterized protein
MNLEIIEQTANHVRELLSGEGSGHDWFHTDRVRRVALHLASEEGADPYVTELAALLHDIADWKFSGGDHLAGSRAARDWLRSLGEEPGNVDHVCEIIDGLSFKGAGVATPMRTLEGMCVQDADRLEAIGAIGVARAFAYGGHKGQPLHDPDQSPTQHATFDDYKAKSSTTINHFYEKLLLLKDRMNTASGKRLAAERHLFMEYFLRQFLDEWNGEW